MRHLFYPVLAITLAACGGGSSAPSSASQLLGLWTADDGTNARAFEFKASDDTHPDLAGKTNVYLLYFYPSGNTPVMVQRGDHVFSGDLLAGMEGCVLVQFERPLCCIR